MKKTTIVLLLLALIAGLFISCSQEMTVDADVHNKINDIDTFCINGKYFSTLQAAVDYFKDSKAMKAPGDNDNVIYLTRNASGPGADIVDIQGLVIDFAGFTYSFTDVTAKQGETGGKFGLSITEGSEVTLKGLEQINLFDSTADLTMVYIEGSDTSLTIEDAPKMKVEPTQYVFWAANGATLTVGSNSTTAPTTISGKIAATGGTTAESKPVVTFNNNTSIKATEFKADAAVVIVNTSSESTVDSFVASNNAVVVVSGSGDVKIESDDSSDTASYEIQNTSSEATITVKEEGESSTTIPAGKAEKVVDGETQPQTDSSYVASNRSGLYTTLDAAMDSLASEDTVLLLANIATSNSYTVQDGVVLTIDFNGRTIISDNVTSTTDVAGFLLNNGTVIFTDNSGSATVGGIYSGNNNVVINNGIMTIEKGFFEGNRVGVEYGDYTNKRGVIHNSETGNMTINNIDLYTAQDYGVLNMGIIRINDGNYISDSRASLGAYGYCVTSQAGNMIMTGGKVRGMHGCISVNGGDATIGGTVIAKTFNTTYDGSVTDNNVYRALYLAGEVSECTTVISGGTFESYSMESCLIGNMNDGGAGASASLTITGGSFTGAGNSQAIKISTLEGYGEGSAFIAGGEFKNTNKSSSANKVISTYTLEDFVIEGYVAVNDNNIWTVVPDTPQVSVVKNGESKGVTMSLASFRDKVNAGNTYEGYTITLLVDVDLENDAWTPIGTSTHPFSGVFNGGGHTVKNFTAHGDSDQGLFGYIIGSDTNIVYQGYEDIINYDEDFSFEPSVNPDGFKEEYYSAVVKNIVIESANVEASNKFAGTLAGETFNTLISDVTVKSSNVKAEKYAGGIVGNVGATVIYKSTVEKGNDVKATTYNAGGIVGGMSYKAGYYPSAVISSKNASDLNMENVSCGCYGGIVGMVNATTTNGRGNVIADCINTGNVSIAVSVGTSDYNPQVGGIAASGQGLSIVGLCENTGNISLSSSVGAANKVIGNAGGIVGGSGGGSTLADKVILYGCSNSGIISASTTYDSKLIFAGGLIGTAAGSAKPNSENDIIIANCSNSGVVTSDGYKSEFAACSAGDLIISMNEFASLEKLSDALPSYIEQYYAKVTVAQNTVSDTSGALLIGHVRNLYLVGLTPITINFTGDFPAKVGGDHPAESMQIYVYDNSKNLADVNIVIPEGKTVGSDTGNNQVFIHGKNINFTNNGTYYGGVKINSDPSNESVVTNNGTWLRNGVNTIDLNNCASWVENSPGTHTGMAIYNPKNDN